MLSKKEMISSVVSTDLKYELIRDYVRMCALVYDVLFSQVSFVCLSKGSYILSVLYALSRWKLSDYQHIMKKP